MRLPFLTLFIVTIFQVSCAAQGTSVTTYLSPEIQANVPSPSIVHGAGFARLSNYNPERSFQEAKRNAFMDLEASILTSVYLEYYGNSITNLRAEFGISDSLLTSQVAMVDSVVVGEWAVYFIRDIDKETSFPSGVIDRALNTNWTYDLFEVKNFDRYWVSSGKHEQTRFNPGRGWTKAKQHALQQLSEYLNTKVQTIIKATENDLSSTHYVTSKHIFTNIGVIGRKMIDGTYHVLVIVSDKDVLQIEG